MCIFCDKIKELPSNLKTSYWSIIEDKYPVNKGHLLIVPKRHIATADELTANEWYELQSVLATAKKLINDYEYRVLREEANKYCHKVRKEMDDIVKFESILYI